MREATGLLGYLEPDTRSSRVWKGDEKKSNQVLTEITDDLPIAGPPSASEEKELAR